MRIHQVAFHLSQSLLMWSHLIHAAFKSLLLTLCDIILLYTEYTKYVLHSFLMLIELTFLWHIRINDGELLSHLTCSILSLGHAFMLCHTLWQHRPCF